MTASLRQVTLDIDELMKKSFLDYSMSVITDRALPDVRDGLKPVHRRILYAMRQMGLTADKAHRKSAGVVGEVLKSYHPHGDASVYDAAVRMAQSWSLLHPLIDGQGNFGSRDGDGAAAYRYTEMRLTRLAGHFFDLINKNTVDMRPNFDNTEEEPDVLPVPFPNIWVNGTDGIAVGMATSIPPHNSAEAIAALLAYIENPDITIREIIEHMPGPDFPTGGIVHDMDGYVQALESGRGRVKLRGTWHTESRKGGGENVVFDSVPYQVNKADLVAKIADLVREKVVEDVTDLRDESSNKAGIRIVIEVRKGTSPDLIASQILSHTDLEKSVNYNATLLIGKQPKQMGILEIFRHYFEFQLSVVQRATQHDLDKALARLHILDGYLKAIGKLDETIALIRRSKDAAEAKTGIMELLAIDDVQAQAILELRLQKLTGMELTALRDEQAQVSANVTDLRDILANESRQVAIVKKSLSDICERYQQPRQTEVSHGLTALTREDLVEREDVLVPITAGGYIKRIPVSAMNRQNRGTRGKSWMATGDDDYVAAVHSGSTHDYLLAFTASGQVHAKKVYQIPEAAAGTKGRHIRNVIEALSENDPVVKIMSVPAFSDDLYLITVSALGNIKRTALSQYEGATRAGGVQAVKIEEGDSILAVDVCRDHDHVVLVASNGKAIRITATVDQLRPMGRYSAGPTGMKLASSDRIVGMTVIRGDGQPQSLTKVKRPTLVDGVETMVEVEELDTRKMDAGNYLLCIGERGVGKRTPVSEFSAQARAGKGVTCFNINGKTGSLIRAVGVQDDQDLIMVSQKGVSNRIHVCDIRNTGRAASGTYLMSLDKGDVVVDVSAVVAATEEGEEQ